MKQQIVLVGLGGVLLGVIFTLALTKTGPASTMMGQYNSSNARLSTSIDQHFIEQMIPHHQDAITMAQLAQQKAKRPEIKQLAQNIIDSQGKEIDQMKSWYTSWFGKDVPTDSQVMGQHGMMGAGGMHMGMMGNDTDLSRLSSTQDFDKAFIEEMIPHHQMAVMMATMLKSGTTRPEMQKLADNIITAQTKEINEMREWYKTW